MTGWHLGSVLLYVTVSVVCHVVFHITFASGSEFDVGSVRVRRSEVGNAHGVSGGGGVVLSQMNGTEWRGFKEPIPA